MLPSPPSPQSMELMTVGEPDETVNPLPAFLEKVLFEILGEQSAILRPLVALCSLMLLVKWSEFDNWKYRLALVLPDPPPKRIRQ